MTLSFHKIRKTKKGLRLYFKIGYAEDPPHIVDDEKGPFDLQVVGREDVLAQLDN